MLPRKHAVAPPIAHWLREPECRVGAAMTRSVDQKLVLGRAGVWTPRDEIDDPTNGRHAVQSGRDPFNHFHLLEVHWWNLEDADRARLGAVERKTVGQHLRVPSAQTLDPDTRSAKRR